MTHYADSSFLVSCYLLDNNTPLARDQLARMTSSLPLGPLHALEIRNAFYLGVFRQLFDESDSKKAWRNLQRDLRAHRLARVAVNWRAVFRRAQQLSAAHSMKVGVRSLDILHVAVAKSLRARQFLTFDARQSALARALGLVVRP